MSCGETTASARRWPRSSARSPRAPRLWRPASAASRSSRSSWPAATASCSWTWSTAAPRRGRSSSSSPRSARPSTSPTSTSPTPSACSRWRRRSAACRSASSSSAARQLTWTSSAKSCPPRLSAQWRPPPARLRRPSVRGSETIEELRNGLARERYLADDGLATVLFLALRLRKPLLVEGEPGVGKTELAKALAAAAGAPLLRLQCYEGIDVHHALYDWDYQRQLLHLRAGGAEQLYSERFLVRRPLLEALKRRCLYHWIDHPDLQREIAVVRARLPELPQPLVVQVCAFVQELRWLDLYRAPGVGETLDWAQSFHALGAEQIDAELADRTLGALLKGREDLERVR